MWSPKLSTNETAVAELSIITMVNYPSACRHDISTHVATHMRLAIASFAQASFPPRTEMIQNLLGKDIRGYLKPKAAPILGPLVHLRCKVHPVALQPTKLDTKLVVGSQPYLYSPVESGKTPSSKTRIDHIHLRCNLFPARSKQIRPGMCTPTHTEWHAIS